MEGGKRLIGREKWGATLLSGDGGDGDVMVPVEIMIGRREGDSLTCEETVTLVEGFLPSSDCILLLLGRTRDVLDFA